VIEDSGPSLHGEAVEELFEPSWDNNPARPSGLGLFTVRNMIGAANGHLSIESAFPAGVKFIMLFPEREVEVVPDERKETLPAPQKNRTVLLVEDNDAIRILLRNAFEKRGFCVIEARDGEEALLQSDLQADPIDLLISDVVMPLMDGPTLARKLTEQRPAMKVILVSGCPVDPSAVRELVAAGAQFIPKPFTQRDLLAQAEKTLAGSRDSVS
jgi:CheY-like chemotaxis protein